MVEQVGLPWHFGFNGLATGGTANMLTAAVGCANTSIPEYKAFLCNIEKGGTDVMSKVNLSQNNSFLIDMTKCTGCRGCQVACKQWNQLEAEKTEFFSGEGYQNPPAMSEYTYTRIKFRDYQKNGQNEFAFYKEMCMHCNDPACASACPVGAFRKTPEGPVIYNADRCIGCRFCMVACPFGVPKYEWSKGLPLVKKCTGCYDRIMEGLQAGLRYRLPDGDQLRAARRDDQAG